MAIGKPSCNHCGLQRTKEGHDGCIGTLENVRNACCGHGDTPVAYVQFDHVIPLSKSGVNALSNGQILCDYCNSIKADRIITIKYLQKLLNIEL